MINNSVYTFLPYCCKNFTHSLFALQSEIHATYVVYIFFTSCQWIGFIKSVFVTIINKTRISSSSQNYANIRLLNTILNGGNHV